MQRPINLLLPLVLCSSLIDANTSSSSSSSRRNTATLYRNWRDDHHDHTTACIRRTVNNSNGLCFDNNNGLSLRRKGCVCRLDSSQLKFPSFILLLLGLGNDDNAAKTKTKRTFDIIDRSILRVRGGGGDDDDDDDTIINQHRYYHHSSKLKRGTRTTGAGARKQGPNRSIFSYTTNNEGDDVEVDGNINDSTTAALEGDVLNRKSSSRSHKTSKNRESESNNNNPMLGKLWAGQSERGTLILKFPKSEETGGSSSVYVELSESSSADNIQRVPSIEDKSSSGINAQYVSSQSTTTKTVQSKSTKSSATANTKTNTPLYVPIEGIYGVYNLPSSGPHVVLITESEEVYTSPPLPSAMTKKGRDTGSSSSSSNMSPLLELRRIKSLEIVSLRRRPNNLRGGNQQTDEQIAEESRQLQLLRRSFKEHDFYFTVPSATTNVNGNGNNPNTDATGAVVRDVTHSLQRSFVEWTGKSQTNEGTEEGVAHDDDDDVNRHLWWMPYVDKESSTKQDRKGDRVVDPRFFWNEQPALSLLPPSTNKAIINTTSSSQSQSPHAMLLNHVIPVTSAFVGVQRNIPIPSSSPSEKEETYDQILISRRSKYRTGTRFTRRGCDDLGNVANYAETEQIVFIVKDDDDNNKDEKKGKNNKSRTLLEVYSHVQTRGSIPLHWSSPAKVKEYRPRVYIGVDPMAQARGLRDHVFGELGRYSSPSTDTGLAVAEDTTATDKGMKLAMVNLIDKHGDQGRLGRAFDSVLKATLEVYIDDQQQAAGKRSGGKKKKEKQKESKLQRQQSSLRICPDSVEHIWYDFHAECKGGRWDKLSHLLEQVMPALDQQGYFCAVPQNEEPRWKIQSLQDGVVRTNCMDCLDRTNVVQSMFGRYVLYRQLHQRLGLASRRRRTMPLEAILGYKHNPLTLPFSSGESSHRNLWADNADAISRLYAGTPALKGDFTRTGERTKKGALDDGINSLQRYYLNNFVDGDRQEGMDLLAGSIDFNNDAIPSTQGWTVGDESSRVFVMQELEKMHRNRRRRGYHESHARIKVEPIDEAVRPRLSLSWLPGDLRHHMRSEESRSKSPLSSAAKDLNMDTMKSSDFLLQVSSSAAKDDEVALASRLESDGALEVPHSNDRKSSSARPWWDELTDTNDSQSDDSDLDDLEGGNDALQLLSFAKKRAAATTLLILGRAPILSAALMVAIIASGFSHGDSE